MSELGQAGSSTPGPQIGRASGTPRSSTSGGTEWGGGEEAVAIADLWLTEDEHLYHQLFDPVTGLPGRVLVRDRLDVALTTARRSQTVVAVVWLTLHTGENRTGRSDTLRPEILERLVAGRIRANIRGDDTVGRVDHGEFVIVCHDIARPDHARHIVARLRQTLAAPVAIGGDGGEPGIAMSIGIAIDDGSSTTPALLASARRDSWAQR